MSDLIYKQAAIDALGERPFVWTGGDYELGCVNQYDLDKLAIETVPSAQPERKRGKWIPKEDRAKQEVFICSVCGGWAYSPWIGSRKNPKPNWCKYLFCPNCGAEMEASE